MSPGKMADTASGRPSHGGADRVRTGDPLLAKQMLYQLSYDPEIGRLCCKELLVLDIYFVRSTGTRKPKLPSTMSCVIKMSSSLLKKEVIQPQVPLRLPCYDFTPVMNHTVVSVLPKVKLPTSGTTHSHGVTGGVYKARERIHRSVLICDY